MKLAIRLSVMLTLATVSLPAVDAAACSAAACPSVEFVPQASTSVADEPPMIPENGAVLTMRTSWDAETGVLTATRVRDGVATEHELAAEGSLVRLEGALEGDLWMVRETHECGGGVESSEASTEVRIGPAANKPITLGALQASEPGRTSVPVADSSGPCSSSLDVVAVDLEVTLDESAEPWADTLRWETLVDGELFAPPHAANEPMRDATEVFVACAEPTAVQYAPDLAEGTHLVQRRAYLPGVEEPIVTDVIEVELRCSEPEVGGSNCAVSPGARGASGGGVLLALAGLVLARRRQRAGQS